MQWDTATIRVPDKPFLTIGEVATAVGYNRKTINRWIKDGSFPAPILMDGVRRWTAMSIGVWMAWMEYGPKAAAESDADEVPARKQGANDASAKGK